MKFPHHIYVLHRLSQVPDASFENGKRIKSMTVDQATACWDYLFQYIHANWAPPKTASSDTKAQWDSFSKEEKAELSDCKKMMEMSYQELEEKLETLPPYFLEHIFPVAVARYLLMFSGNKIIPFNHTKSTTFKEFHKRYGSMILS